MNTLAVSSLMYRRRIQELYWPKQLPSDRILAHKCLKFVNFRKLYASFAAQSSVILDLELISLQISAQI